MATGRVSLRLASSRLSVTGSSEGGGGAFSASGRARGLEARGLPEEGELGAS